MVTEEETPLQLDKKEVMQMFMIFNDEGTLVAMVTLRGAETTTILEVLEDAQFTVKLLDQEDQLTT